MDRHFARNLTTHGFNLMSVIVPAGERKEVPLWIWERYCGEDGRSLVEGLAFEVEEEDFIVAGDSPRRPGRPRKNPDDPKWAQ